MDNLTINDDKTIVAGGQPLDQIPSRDNEVDCDQLEESIRSIGVSLRSITSKNEIDCDELEESLRSVGAHRVRTLDFGMNCEKPFASSNVTSSVLQQEKQSIAYPRFGRNTSSTSTTTTTPGDKTAASDTALLGAKAGASGTASLGVGSHTVLFGGGPALRGIGKNQGRIVRAAKHHQSATLSGMEMDPQCTKASEGTAPTLASNCEIPHHIPHLDSASDDATSNHDDAQEGASVEVAPQGGEVLASATMLNELGYRYQTTVHRTEGNHDGLVEALPVNSSHHSSRRLAEPVGNSFRYRVARGDREEKYKRIACIIVAIVCVLLTVSFTVGMESKKKSTDIVAHDMTSTPSPISPLQPMKNLDILYEALPEKTKENLYNSNSPQYQAWEWLLNHPNITTYPEWRKKQVFAMVTLYYSFEGPRWPEATPGHSRWLDVNASECSWVLSNDEVAYWAEQCPLQFGPAAYDCAQLPQPCNEDGKLKALIISRLYITDNLNPSIPPEIEMLTSLKVVVIGWGRINSKLSNLLVPEVINKLPRLDIFGLYGLGLAGTLPPEIGLMTGLRHLVIGANHLTGTFPSEIARMTSLEHLMLDDTAITGTLPSEIGLMTSLTALEIARNSFSGLIPSELGLLRHSMWRLLLGGNLFSGTLPGSIWDLSHLDRLHLSNLPNLHGSIPANLFMPNLTILSLSGSSFLSGTIPEDICNVEELNFDCSDWLCGCGCNCIANVNGTSL